MMRSTDHSVVRIESLVFTYRTKKPVAGMSLSDTSKNGMLPSDYYIYSSLIRSGKVPKSKRIDSKEKYDPVLACKVFTYAWFILMIRAKINLNDKVPKIRKLIFYHSRAAGPEDTVMSKNVPMIKFFRGGLKIKGEVTNRW